MPEVHILFVPGTHVPPSIFDQVRLPSKTTSQKISWMEEVRPCRMEETVKYVSSRRHPGKHNILVGHSSGAVIAALAALHAPADFAGLVLINSGPNMKEHRSIGELLQRLAGPLKDQDWEELAHTNFSTFCTPESIQLMVDYSRHIGGVQASTFLRDQSQIDLLAWPPLTDFPVEVLHGSMDKKRGVFDAFAWREIFPDANVVLDPSCGHTPPLEHPTSVTESLERIYLRIDPTMRSDTHSIVHQ